MAPVRRIWPAMKKHPIRTSLAVALVVIVLLVVRALVPPAAPTLPSFQFLAGRNPALQLQDQEGRPRGWSQDFYSFTSGFETVCAAAETELLALGYRPAPQHPGSFFSMREYERWRSSSEEPITVRIIDARLVVLSTPKNSQYSSPDRCTYKRAPGWVTVEVYQRDRPEFWLWGEIRYRVTRLLQRLGVSKGRSS